MAVGCLEFQTVFSPETHALALQWLLEPCFDRESLQHHYTVPDLWALGLGQVSTNSHFHVCEGGRDMVLLCGMRISGEVNFES